MAASVPPGAHRIGLYKARVLSVDKIRAKRKKEDNLLRKERRYEQFQKRRSIEKQENRLEDEDEKIPGSNVNEKNKVEDKIDEDTPLDKLANIVMEGVGEKRLEAVTMIRRLLSTRNPPIDDVIETGIVPHLIDCVDPAEPVELQMESAWALTNIASGNSEQTAAVVKGGGVARFIQLMQAPSSSVREQVVWALGNISGESSEYRDLLLDFGVVASLNGILENGNEEIKVKRTASWLLSNICRHKHSQLHPDAIEKLLPLFVSGFDCHEDKDVFNDLCWGLSYLTEDGDEKIVQMVLDSGVLETVVDLMDDDAKDLASAVRFVGNITTGTDSQTQQIINAGGLVKLKSLMLHPKPSIQREACWAISNITAGTTDQKQAVINNEIVPVLVDIITQDEHPFKTKKEAVWALTNITENATEQQVTYLVGLGIIQTLMDVLKLHEVEMVRISLDGLIGILESGVKEAPNPYAMMIAGSPELVAQLEELLQNEHMDIYNKVCKLMDSYITPAVKLLEDGCVEDQPDSTPVANKNKNIQLR